jgi:iduronate 2-sulfatase
MSEFHAHSQLRDCRFENSPRQSRSLPWMASCWSQLEQRPLLGWLVGFWVGLFTLSLTAPAADTPPAPRWNVLFIAVDDMRAELGCYGSPVVQSPNLDALAQRSLLLEHAYCQQAVCNPSRASLLTGMRLDTLGFYDLPTHFRERFPDVVTLPQLFKQHGYQTHGIGKIFHNYRQDQWRGDAVSWSVEQVLHYGSHAQDLASVVGQLPANQLSIPRVEKRDVPDNAYWDGQIADLAVARLQQLQDQTFFLGVGFWKPHLQFNAPAKYWNLYDPADISLPANPDPPVHGPSIALHGGAEVMRGFPDGLSEADIKTLRHGYYAAISYVDAQIGKVLDELKRLGLEDKTLVVFWSDHGFHLGEHSLWCKNSNFELDARVPLMISVPGQTTAGQRAMAPVELLDIYPTLADYCHLPLPAHVAGLSMRPMVEDPQASIRDFALTQNPRPATGEAKEQPIMGYSVRSATHRYTQWQDRLTGEVIARELYDHRIDPLETFNRADELDAQPIVAQHTEYLERALR